MSLLFHIFDRATDKKYDAELRDDPHVTLHIQGYGDKCSGDYEGAPILLDMEDGKLKLYVWSDINQEDPTHIISLEGARIENRKEDQCI